MVEKQDARKMRPSKPADLRRLEAENRRSASGPGANGERDTGQCRGSAHRVITGGKQVQERSKEFPGRGRPEIERLGIPTVLAVPLMRENQPNRHPLAHSPPHRMADNMRRLVDTDGIEQVDRILRELRRVEYGPLGASDLTTPQWSKTMTR